MVEAATARGRVAYGPVRPESVPALFDARFIDGRPHELCLGPTEEIPYLKNQERLTFARVGVIDPHLARRLRRAWRIRGAETRRAR